MIVTKRATLADLEKLVDLRIEFLYEAEEINEEMPSEELRTSLRQYFKEHMTRGTFVAWVALHEDKIVATSGVSFYTVPPSFGNISGRVAYIMNMYTLPGWRRRGIGAILLNKSIEEAEKRGIKKLQLHATEIGRSLYSKRGFQSSDIEMVMNLE